MEEGLRGAARYQHSIPFIACTPNKTECLPLERHRQNVDRSVDNYLTPSITLEKYERYRRWLGIVSRSMATPLHEATCSNASDGVDTSPE